MNIEQLDNIHFSDYFHGLPSICITIIYFILTSIYQNRKNTDANLNKVQNNRSISIHSCPGQQSALGRSCPPGALFLRTDTCEARREPHLK